MNRNQLEEIIDQLTEELDKERKERNYFQVERDKIQAFWDTCEKTLEDTQDDLRKICRETQEAEERHQAEVTAYKQKLKHILSEHNAAINDLKTQGVVSSMWIQKQHTKSERELTKEIHDLQADISEKQLSANSYIDEMKRRHQFELNELSSDYDSRISEIENKYDRQMELMKDEGDKKSELTICQFEEQIHSHLNILREEQKKNLRNAEEYFSTTHRQMVAFQKLLQQDVAEAKKQQVEVEGEMLAVLHEARTLQASLYEVEQKLPRRQVFQLCPGISQLKIAEKQLRDASLEQELLIKEIEQVKQERDELLRNRAEGIAVRQEKSGVKQMLLEEKVEALTDALEKEKAQVCAIEKCLQETTASKDATIKTLHGDLAQVSLKYNNLLQRPKTVRRLMFRPQR